MESRPGEPNPNKTNLQQVTRGWLTHNHGGRNLVTFDDYAGSAVDKFIERYRPKFVLWAQKRVKANGGWPKEQNRTKVIKEFLARGFIHQSDAPYTPGHYPIITLIGELQWPVSFAQHQEALEVSQKFGIPGYTKCPLPKQK